MTPKTQSVCNHCHLPVIFEGNYWLEFEDGVVIYDLCEKNPNGRHEVSGYGALLHEPVAEPASTGEPGTGFYRSASLQESIAQDEVERAARPSEPSVLTKVLNYKFDGCGESPSLEQGTEKSNLATHPLSNEHPSKTSDPAAPPCQHLHRVYQVGNTYCDDCKIWLHAGSVDAAPQTSAEPPDSWIECKGRTQCTYCANGSVAIRTGNELTYKHYVPAAPQPVSGDAPKVQEIVTKIIQQCGLTEKFRYVLPLPAKDFLTNLLRPYFPPASQTPQIYGNQWFVAHSGFLQFGPCSEKTAKEIVSTKSANDLEWEAVEYAPLSGEHVVSQTPQLKSVLDVISGLIATYETGDHADNPCGDCVICTAEQVLENLATPASTARTDGQLYVISVTGDGGKTTIVPESQLKQSLHEAYCACGKDWQKCSDEVVTNTIAKLDDDEEWTQNYPNYERHIWFDKGEDYTVQVMRVAAPGSVPQTPMCKCPYAKDQSQEWHPVGSLGCTGVPQAEPPNIPWSDWAHKHMTALRNAIFATIPEEEKNANMGDEALVAWPAELLKRLTQARGAAQPGDDKQGGAE